MGQFFDTEEIKTKKTWEKEWDGMPEYDQPDSEPYKIITMRFRSEEDAQKFFDLIEQTMSDKQQSLWYPKWDPYDQDKPHGMVSDKIYVDDEEPTQKRMKRREGK